MALSKIQGRRAGYCSAAETTRQTKWGQARRTAEVRRVHA
jgi:hypothetical protein